MTAKNQIGRVGVRGIQALCYGIGMSTSTVSTARCGPACRVVWEGTGQLYSGRPYPDFVPNFAIDLTSATTSWRCQPQTVQPSGDRLVNLCFANENRGNSRFFRLLEKSKLCVAKRLLGEFAATSSHMFPIRLLIFPNFVPCFG